MQQTSLQAFEEVKPRLSARREQVYEVLHNLGAMTNVEIARYLELPINCVTGRTNELVKMGFVEKKIIDNCSVTTNKATRWGLTNKNINR